jgi:hypothetical protein
MGEFKIRLTTNVLVWSDVTVFRTQEDKSLVELLMIYLKGE